MIEGEGALLSVLHCSRVGRTQVSVTKWDTLFPIRQDPCQQFQNSKTFRTPTRLMLMAGTLLALWAMSAFSYQRRQPDKTLLYRIIHENLATFLERTEQSGGTIPWFVRREFMEFSRCGVLAHGFARFECRQCRTNRVVAFSCKRRGFCPSCGGRRMTERAARLVDSVLPAVPIRQWVLSVPVKVRYLIAYDSQLCSLMIKLFTHEVFRWYRRRGKSHLQLKSMAALRCGSVTCIQRAGSS